MQVGILYFKTEKGRLSASPSGFRSFEINVKNVEIENCVSPVSPDNYYYTQTFGKVNNFLWEYL